MPFPVAAMAGLQIGSSLLGGLTGSRAARRRAQAYATAGQMVDEGYRTADDLLMPRADQEQSAIELVNSLLGLTDMPVDYSRFRDSPGYQFMQDESARAIERSAAARGDLLSGNTAIALQDRSANIADTTFQNYLLNIMGLAGQGVDRARAGLAVDRGVNAGNLVIGQGEARASGIEEIGNALLGGLQGGAGILGQNWATNNLFPSRGFNSRGGYGTAGIPAGMVNY